MDPATSGAPAKNPVEAIGAVIKRIKHVHIRDCKGRQQNPGAPEMQANGRGDIDLLGYIRVLHENGYTEAGRPGDHRGQELRAWKKCVAIAAESRGHMPGVSAGVRGEMRI
jgi:D-mannonate dehydratase